jgi:hypothetical protein
LRCSSSNVHSDYGRREALRRKQCQELAYFELPKEIEWSAARDHGRGFDRAIAGGSSGGSAAAMTRSPPVSLCNRTRQ